MVGRSLLQNYGGVEEWCPVRWLLYAISEHVSIVMRCIHLYQTEKYQYFLYVVTD